jgi:light-regulated signal transduction histidine kinase (bacteriophytochrome)
MSCLASPITTGEKNYGVIVVALPTRFLNDVEEQELFSELAIDLALALHSMEMNEIRQQTEETNWRIMEELARSNTELEQFASIISHDLREPVRMVGSFVELLSRNYAGKLDEKADQYIYFAADGAKRMQEMINNILDYSRVTTRGKTFEETDLSSIVEEVIRDLSVKIQESGAEIITGDMPTVKGDRSQLTRVFHNLVANALKFHGQEPPRVEISARLDGAEWIISVQDNGVGIEPRFFKKIFYIFQRLHLQEEYPGTGIGLAITRKILDRHKGRIDVESQPGEGSTFFFTLPVMVKEETANGGTD